LATPPSAAPAVTAVHVISPVDLAAAQKLRDFRKSEGLRISLAGADVTAALRSQHVQVRGQAVRGDGFEEAVLQDVKLRVIPIIGKLALVVPAHHVTGLLHGPGDEAVHQAAVDTGEGVGPVVRPSLVDQSCIVGRAHARPTRIRDADAGRQAFSSGIGSEIVIEAAVLLHDEDEMPDLFEAGRGDGRWSGLGRRPV